MRGPDSLLAHVPAEVEAAVEAAMEQARTRGAEVWEAVSPEVGAALEEARSRGGAALDALRGGPVGPPVAVRRWPVAITAALAGAAAAAAVALLLRRLRTQDAPGALEPEQVEAVVDRPS